MAFDYAVIVAGRVTSVVEGAVSIPASDATTYYHEIRAGETLPSVDDYFSEPCMTFSAAAPVIPPGDIAPPFPPGTTPPAPGDPDYPTYDDPVDDVGPLPPPVVVPSLLTFHANDSDTLAVTVPSARTALANLLQTAFDFSRVCSFRLQAWIETAVAGRLAAEWYNATAAEWQAMDGGALGPTLDVSAAGYARGDWQSPAAALVSQGDAIVRLVAEAGADGALVTGNVGLLILSNTGAGGPCVSIPPWSPPECAAPAATLVEDFSSYADWAAFIAFVNGQPYTGGQLFSRWNFQDTEGTQGRFDLAKTFNGNPSLNVVLDDLVTFSGFVFSEWNTATLESPSDLTYFLVFELGADFAPPETTLQDSGQNNYHLAFINFAEFDGTSPFDEGRIIVYDDTVWWVWYPSGGPFSAPVSLGPLADWIGEKKQLLIRSRTVGTTVTTDIYLNAPCSEPTLYATVTDTTARANGGMGSVDVFWRSASSSGGAELWIYQMAMDTDPAVFGL